VRFAAPSEAFSTHLPARVGSAAKTWAAPAALTSFGVRGIFLCSSTAAEWVQAEVVRSARRSRSLKAKKSSRASVQK
jgi:hypothetical protein